MAYYDNSLKTGGCERLTGQSYASLQVGAEIVLGDRDHRVTLWRFVDRLAEKRILHDDSGSPDPVSASQMGAYLNLF